MTREEAKLYMTLYKQRLVNSVAVAELSDDIAAFDMAIKSLEPMTGHWINYKDEHQCSQCRETVIADMDVWEEYPYDFCPNCGADMRGEK